MSGLVWFGRKVNIIFGILNQSTVDSLFIFFCFGFGRLFLLRLWLRLPLLTHTTHKYAITFRSIILVICLMIVVDELHNRFESDKRNESFHWQCTKWVMIWWKINVNKISEWNCGNVAAHTSRTHTKVIYSIHLHIFIYLFDRRKKFDGFVHFISRQSNASNCTISFRVWMPLNANSSWYNFTHGRSRVGRQRIK